MTDDRTAGEQMLEAYLDEHGYEPPAYEPDLGVVKRPDYVVARDGAECVCELKEFDESTSTPWGGGQRVGTTSMEIVLQPVRAKIRAAARQLKPLAGGDRPLVIVLANPSGVMIPLDDQDLVWAMYGDPTYTIPIDPTTGGPAGDATFTTGRNGKLRNDHPYVSAVAVVRRRERAYDFFDELSKKNADLDTDARVDAIFAAERAGKVQGGAYHRIDVFRTLSPSAVPLPDTFFDGPNDRTFDFDESEGVYRQARGRIFA